ncbi:hypothetical protein DFH11DRAFT_1631678 [Phellopilus nigrolimitatus]|nr:hypothetical protein DFH11DRAFT_1631678 [Phellopilus nigrolimitatus]
MVLHGIQVNRKLPDNYKYCEFCSRPVGLKGWIPHIKSPKHLENVSNSTAGNPGPPLDHIFCTRCKQYVSDSEWQAHVQGGKHLRKVEKDNALKYCELCMRDVRIKTWNSHVREQSHVAAESSQTVPADGNKYRSGGLSQLAVTFIDDENCSLFDKEGGKKMVVNKHPDPIPAFKPPTGTGRPQPELSSDDDDDRPLHLPPKKSNALLNKRASTSDHSSDEDYVMQDDDNNSQSESEGAHDSEGGDEDNEISEDYECAVSGTPESIRKRAVHVCRLVDLAPDLDKLLAGGRRQLRTERERAARREPAAKRRKSSNVPLSLRDSESFSLLCLLIPELPEELLRSSEDEVKKLAKQIGKPAIVSRANDVSRLKKEILDLLAYVDKETFNPEVVKLLHSKESRGFQDDRLGEMLCPVSLKWRSSRIRKKIRAGEIIISADQFPLVLYKDLTCDVEDLEAGLLMNELLVRVFRFLFTGRNSAFSDSAGNQSGRATNSKLAGMTEVTPRAIAYCACLLRFSLSDKEGWSLKDGDFDMEEFYWNIVAVFEDAGEFAEGLLVWWNARVFGSKLSCAKAKRRADEISTMDRLKAQRAAKRAHVDGA